MAKTDIESAFGIVPMKNLSIHLLNLYEKEQMHGHRCSFEL